MAWKILETKPSSAEANMRRDAELLENLGDEESPILHLYSWERESITFGHFVRPEKVLNLLAAKEKGLDLARRPTGGGVVFHLWDLAFSVLIPAKSRLFSMNTLDNYRLVNGVVQEVVEEFMGSQGLQLTPEDAPFQDLTCTHFCMARPTKYDLILGDKKIAGAAQRKTKDGFLHQGTIALMRPDVKLLDAVLPSEAVRQAMVQTTFPVLPEGVDLNEGRQRLCELLKRYFTKL